MIRSPLGRAADDVKQVIIGTPFKVSSETIGEVIDAWVHKDGLIIKVKFNHGACREFQLNPEAWDRIFDYKLRIQEIKNAVRRIER